MIALRLVHLIEKHSSELSEGLTSKILTSARTNDMNKVPTNELRIRTREILQNLSEWLLTKSAADIDRRYLELGSRRAAQGVALADYCWAIVLTKEYIWDFLQRQGFLQSPVEIYGEMELLRLLDQFFDRAICSAVKGYHQNLQGEVVVEIPVAQRAREAKLAG